MASPESRAPGPEHDGEPRAGFQSRLGPWTSGPLPHDTVGEVAWLFLKLGCTAFGGPAAHIALMRREVVQRRKWVTEAQFVDLLGATNLIPGPNSTEMAIHLGYLRAGWPGLILGGALFILPALLVVLAIAWAYVTYRTLPAVGWLLYGIKPVVIAVVLQALWSLRAAALRSPLLWGVALGTFALELLGVSELLLLFGGALLVLALRALSGRGLRAVLGLPLLLPATAPLAAPLLATTPYSAWTLFLTFLKIGAVLYGGGYVLLAFLRGDFVERLGWLSEQQLLDAVAVGQFTPGPLFTTATFVGYLVGGVWGGLVATLGIFLPSFIFVALTNPFIPRLRAFGPTAALLDGVNAAALGLMAAVTVELARAALVDAISAVVALAALLVLLRTNVNSVWLILGGGLVGVAARLALG